MSELKAAIFDLGVTLIRTERSKPFQERLLELGVSRDEDEIQKAFDFSDKYFMKNYPGELGQDPKDFYAFICFGWGNDIFAFDTLI